MLKQTKDSSLSSPLKQFKDFYFSSAGREELQEALNSKIYQIVSDSIAGDKKRVDLKFLFSFYSQEFIICDSQIHASELRPVKEMDDFLLLGSFYLNRNLKLYKELVEVFEEFDFDEFKLKPEIEKLSNFIIDKHLTPEVAKLILDSSSEKVGTVKERLRIYELRNGEHPLRLLNQKDLIEFLMFFADTEVSVSRNNFKKLDFENLVSEEVYKLIITSFKDLTFDILEDGALYNVDFDSFYKLHAVGLISDHTTIQLFNKARFFFHLLDNRQDKADMIKMISLISDAKNNGLSFKISDDAKSNLELLIQSIDSGLSISDNGQFNNIIKSFYSVLDY